MADRQDMEVIKETKSELEDHDSTQKESNYSHFSELDTSSADLLSSKSSKLSAQKRYCFFLADMLYFYFT